MRVRLAYSFVKRLRHFSKSSDLVWRYTFNLGPSLAYRFADRSLSTEAARVLDDLNRQGVAITSAWDLLDIQSRYHELRVAVDQLELEWANELDAARPAKNQHETIGKKTYIYQFLSKHPSALSNNIYAKFALQRPIVQIANAYFGLLARLSYYDVWHTFPSQAPARESQLWHRDPEDRYILKVFVNLSLVDDGAGPFTYASGTHPKGASNREAKFFVEEDGGKRSDDSQMAEIVPPAGWIKGVGPEGTIIFADTRGYHKGGLARERDRLTYVCRFLSRAAS